MTEELKQLREALRRVKHEATSLADAQVIALEALTPRPAAQAMPHDETHDWSDRIAKLQRPASLPTQPAAQANAKPDLSGHDAFDVLSQGYPTHPADCRCEWCKGKPAAQATPEPLPLGPLAKRNIYDAIRGAYDLGYNDARNARTVPGDSAPGYDGRSVEEDHGSALFNLLSKRLKPATPEPVGEPVAWRYKIPTHGGGTAWTHTRPQPECLIEAQPLYIRPAPGVPEIVQRNAARWGTLKASKPQLGISWLGVPFVGFELTGPANKAWADSVKSGLDVDDAMDAVMLAAAQAKGADHDH